MSATARQKSGNGIDRYVQRVTDCLNRPFLTMRSPRAGRAKGRTTAASACRLEKIGMERSLSQLIDCGSKSGGLVGSTNVSRAAYGPEGRDRPRLESGSKSGRPGVTSSEGRRPAGEG